MPDLEKALSLAESLKNAITFVDEDDCITNCGPSPLSILQKRPDDVLSLAHEKLHTWKFTEVPECWRRLYEEASLWKVIHLIDKRTAQSPLCLSPRGQKRKRNNSAAPIPPTNLISQDEKKSNSDDWVSEVVYVLDMAMILTGAPGRRELILEFFESLQIFTDVPTSGNQDFDFEEPSCTGSIVDTFTRKERLDFLEFQEHLDTSSKPLILLGVIDQWPAINQPKNRWSDPRYLLKATLGGRRLVPVELGRSYTDENWSQKIMTFAEYMETYLLRPKQEPTGYLAQHDLFAQVPSLAADTSTPDYCYTTPPSPETESTVPVSTLEEPLRNAWLGPAGTVSPLHTDPYHNILCQVVGHKYIRLYAPSETPKLYPRGIDETGINMENTSFVDISLAKRIFHESSALDIQADEADALGNESASQEKAEFEARFPRFKDAQYIEGVLGPGECLYIPVGWWHYVESLSTSFSMSFWWN